MLMSLLRKQVLYSSSSEQCRRQRSQSVWFSCVLSEKLPLECLLNYSRDRNPPEPPHPITHTAHSSQCALCYNVCIGDKPLTGLQPRLLVVVLRQGTVAQGLELSSRTWGKRDHGTRVPGSRCPWQVPAMLGTVTAACACVLLPCARGRHRTAPVSPGLREQVSDHAPPWSSVSTQLAARRRQALRGLAQVLLHGTHRGMWTVPGSPQLQSSCSYRGIF